MSNQHLFAFFFHGFKQGNGVTEFQLLSYDKLPNLRGWKLGQARRGRLINSAIKGKVMPSKNSSKKNISEVETSEDRSRVKTIVLAAIELAPSKRNHFIETACGDDEHLNQQVRNLLSIYDSNQPTMLDQDFGRILATELNDVSAPTVFGKDSSGAKRSFRLGRQLGSGSFGKVFLASQTAPVEREVAVKLLHKESVSSIVADRFLAEHRAQAIMSHPNIASMLDAGKTEDGRPFLIIEYVDGSSVTEYCSRHEVDFQQRLKIFTDVCRAVQHAHQKSVIHRDLKPSNVLVTVIDGEPVAKVIDFGVAKILRPSETRQQLTERGQFVGSLAYMSPEQARADADIDTSSDIYGLGVLLYQLLTGTLPFGYDKNDEPLPPLDALKQICHAPPLPPWVAFEQRNSHSSATGPAVLKNQQRLHSALKEDLGWIIMKCLEKERARRYASAGNLIDDIENYLQNRPVSAAAPTRNYLIRKFVSRNKGAIAICTAIALSVILGVVGMISAAQAQQRVAKQRLVAKHERALGATAALMAEETKLILGKLITISSLLQDPQSRSVLIAALDLTAQRLEEGRAGNALVESRLHRVIGLAYAGVEDYLSAQIHLLESIKLEEDAGRAGWFYRSSKLALGQVYRSDQNPATAEKLAREVLALQEAAAVSPPQETIDALLLISKLHDSRGQYLEALDMCNRMKQVAKNAPAISKDLQSKVVYQTAHINFQLRRFETAKKAVQELLAMKDLSKDALEFRRVRHNYTAAKTFLACGELAIALRLTDQALEWGNMAAETNLRLIEIKALLLLQKNSFEDAKELIQYGLRLQSSQWQDEIELETEKGETALAQLDGLCDQKRCNDKDFNELRETLLGLSIAEDDHLALIRLPSDRDELH